MDNKKSFLRNNRKVEEEEEEKKNLFMWTLSVQTCDVTKRNFSQSFQEIFIWNVSHTQSSLENSEYYFRNFIFYSLTSPPLWLKVFHRCCESDEIVSGACRVQCNLWSTSLKLLKVLCSRLKKENGFNSDIEVTILFQAATKSEILFKRQLINLKIAEGWDTTHCSQQ